MMDIDFAALHVLPWLALVVIVAVLDLGLRRKEGHRTWPHIRRLWAGPRGVVEAASLTRMQPRRIFLWLGLACCVFALARPRWGKEEEKVFQQSREVLIALDLSRSMLANDVQPSRLERCKLLLRNLLDRLSGERIGLVLFAGTAFLQSPLSADYEVLREYLPHLEPSYLPQGGTDYHAMIETALDAFSESGEADRFLIVLSDGESLQDDWRGLIPKLKERGVRVISLGVGTAEGSIITDSKGELIKDDRGAAIRSRLNPETLKALAEATDGQYEDAAVWVDLPDLIQRTVERGATGSFEEQRRVRHIERFQWPLGAGLLFLVLSLLREFPVRPRVRDVDVPRRKNAPIGGPRPLPRPARARSEPTGVGAAGSSGGAGTWLRAVALGVATASLAHAAEPGDPPAELPNLPDLIGPIATKPDIPAQDFASVAETTIQYGNYQLSKGRLDNLRPVIEDGLAAVTEGERKGPDAAPWPHLRKQLEDLLRLLEATQKMEQERKREEEEQRKRQQQQQQQQQNQQGQGQQQQKPQSGQPSERQQQQGSGSQSEQQQQSGQEGQQPQEQQQAGQKQGDEQRQGQGEEREDQRGKEGDKEKDPQQAEGKPNETQRIGGRPAEYSKYLTQPELNEAYRRLEEVRRKDSPARLFQLLRGEATTNTAPRGQDW